MDVFGEVRMQKHLLFIHGGGADAYEADQPLAASLQAALGSDYDVSYPRMPHPDQPSYAAWKDTIIQHIGATEGEICLVGHSFGASILLKILTEVTVPRLPSGVFLVATPFWGAADWEVDEYALRDDFAASLLEGLPIFLYHSRDDDVVPFDHLSLYANQFPQATLREFDGRGHQFNDDLADVAADIRDLGFSNY